ncbi:glycosyltransferase [Methylobacterium sp. NEAU 140]|uniref:glycosyltransferase family 2 protein n=1 Tax=Methylobacterium sp. NEAU 140 TaxID=3064945 RepID=UPI002736824C|nr:glycosyltransferase [Methylobacterium sp. NEAU 140]MDP4026006.1 glycosyltransferase [Methylobacterium sp. NEAU 140]
MIPTYNRSRYLKEALESVLRQDPGRDRMQIGVLDNATSTFDVKHMIENISPGRIEYIRHSKNIGGIKNINSCIAASRGLYVHILHDDDMVLEDFYLIMEDAILENSTGTIFMAPIIGIDENGHEIGRSFPPCASPGVIQNFRLEQAFSNRAPTQTLVIPRAVYERVGGYTESLSFTPDWEMAFRAASDGCAVAATTTKPLAAARWHSGSDSAKIIQGTRHIIEMKTTIDELVGRLTQSEKANVHRKKYSFPAMAAAHYASILKNSGNKWGALINLCGALMLEPTAARLKSLIRELLPTR